MFTYVVMCHWIGAACSVSSYAAITHFFTTFPMKYCGYEVKTELVARRLEVDLMRAFEVLVVGVVRGGSMGYH